MLPLCVSPGKVQSESRNQRHRLHSHQAGKSIIQNVYLSTYDFINKINNIIGKVLLQTLPQQTNIWIFRKIKCLFGFMIFQCVGIRIRKPIYCQRQGCESGSASALIRINFTSWIRIRIQYVDTDPVRKNWKIQYLLIKVILFLKNLSK